MSIAGYVNDWKIVYINMDWKLNFKNYILFSWRKEKIKKLENLVRVMLSEYTLKLNFGTVDERSGY